jgi:hypothetical protein
MNGGNESSRPVYDPTAVARLLVSTGEKLVALLASETQKLRGSKAVEIAALTPEKTRLSQVFAAGWRQFQADPRRLDQISAALRGELLGTAQRVNAVAVENEQVLRIGQRAAELVLAALARALSAQRPQPPYTPARLSRIPPRGPTGLGFSRSA